MSFTTGGRPFATHVLEDGYGIRTVHEVFGHKDVKTTMSCAYALNRGQKKSSKALLEIT